MTAAAVVSLFFFQIEALHSLIVFGVAVALSGLIVRRLRAGEMPWWLVFLGFIPIVGWIILAALVSHPRPESPHPDGEQTEGGRITVARVVLPFVATFVTLALLVASAALAVGREDTTSPEAAESAGPVNLEPSEKDPPGTESLSVPREAPAAEPDPELDPPAPPEEEETLGLEVTVEGFDQLVGRLTVAPEVTAGYDRDLFRHWSDADGDGCDTRREVLIAESVTPVTVGGSCSLNGGEWVSAFDGVRTTDPSTFDVDHFVPLKEAWDSGADAWDETRREGFANDIEYAGSLIAVSASSNRSKGASDPAEWLPPNGGYHCQYVITWVEVKLLWDLSADTVEIAALKNYGAGC